MKKLLLSVIAILIFPLIASAFDGPLQSRNQFPLFGVVNTPYLEKAGIENSFSAVISYSSVYLVDNSAKWGMGLDMEITELNLRAKKNLNDFMEIGIELPILGFSSGFMDGFLNRYHDVFGFPDYGRSRRPENEFLYEVRRDNTLIVKGKNGRIQIGDIRLTLKKPVLKSDPAVSVQASIEFPSGDAKAGFGNGSLDTGLSVMMEKNLGDKLSAYLNFGIVFPGDLRGYERVTLRDYLYGGAAVEVAFWKDISLLGQIFIQGSPLPETDIPSMDGTAVLLSLGGRYSSGKNTLELSLTEDPNTSGAPDFTMNFSFRRLF
ncbi:MAG: DUF3187 family protein [Thermodesulfovibrionales bacterium]|nr:DUF3187 family protein [Thermodesulfovibrionales bacterium]